MNFNTNTLTIYEFDRIRYKLAKSSDTCYFDKAKNILYLTEEVVKAFEELKINDEFVFEVNPSYIRVKGFIGMIKFDNIAIEILPKFLRYEKGDTKSIDIIRRNLLFMLDYIFPDLKIMKNIADLKTTKNLNILELFVYIFSKNLLNLLKFKLYRDYIRKSDNLKFIKGRILFHRYNIAKLNLVPCEFFEYSLDNIINRILKFSCYILLKLVRYPQNYWLLKQILSILNDVKLTYIYPKDFENIRYNRLNSDFKIYIDFCKLLLSNVSTTLEPASDVKFFSFLYPMHDLFEKFIGRVIQKHKDQFFGTNTKVKLQEYIGFIVVENHRKRFRLKPDIVVQNKNAKYIIDTKYKLIRGNLSREDVYQMYIYGYKSNAEKMLILYPRHLYSKVLDLELIYNDHNTKLYVRPVDLSVDLYKDFNKFLHNLGEVLKNLKR